MGPGPPESYPTGAFAPNHPALHGGALYTERHYYSPHTLDGSSPAPIHRPTSLRQRVRARENATIKARPRSPRESYTWAQEPGSDLPHPVALSSTNPAQQDFRTLHESQAPLADSLDEFSDPGPSNEATVDNMTSDTGTTGHGGNGTPPLAPLRTPDEVYEHFPHQSLQHGLMRARLLHVMNSSWRRMNEKEPDPQILLQFTSKIDEHGSEKYKCLIWMEGTECGKKIPRYALLPSNSSFFDGAKPFLPCRSDRMLEHLR